MSCVALKISNNVLLRWLMMRESEERFPYDFFVMPFHYVFKLRL